MSGKTVFGNSYLKISAMILLIAIVVFGVIVLKFYHDERIERLEITHDEILRRLESIEKSQRNPFAPAIDRAKQAIVHISGGGSGIIIDKNKGYILTNYHVIKNKNVNQIDVILPNPNYRDDIAMGFPTSIVGYDRRSDLALLKSLISIKGQYKISEIKWGNSKNLQIGEYAIAIGYPYPPVAQANPTITAGIISATNRSRFGKRHYIEMIQTDAAINPGNSGGALVNIHGQLIGINTRIFSSDGDSDGIGFAIPAHNARTIVEQLIEHGWVIPPYLGIHTQPVTSDLREKTGIRYDGGISAYASPRGLADDGIPNYSGVYVAEVDKGSPADNAGLKHGDLIQDWARDEIPISQGISTYNESAAIENETHFKTLTRLLPINQKFYFFFKRPIINPNSQSEVSETSYIRTIWMPARPVELQPEVLQWNYTPPGWEITFKQPNREESEKYKHRGIIATNIMPESPLATDLRSGDLIYEIIRKKEKEEIIILNDPENEIHSLEEFTMRTSNLTPCEDFWFHFERDGKNKVALITIPKVPLKEVVADPESWKKVAKWAYHPGRPLINPLKSLMETSPVDE